MNYIIVEDALKHFNLYLELTVKLIDQQNGRKLSYFNNNLSHFQAKMPNLTFSSFSIVKTLCFSLSCDSKLNVYNII